MRDQLLATLNARLDDGDPHALLTGDAEVELDQLMGYLAAPGGLDAQVGQAVGRCHLARAEARHRNGDQELQRAAVVLLPLVLSHPDAFPESVRRWLEPASTAMAQSGDTPEQTMGRALTDVAWLLLERLGRHDINDRDGRVAELTQRAVGYLPHGHAARPAALCAHGYALLSADSAEASAPQDRVEHMVEVFQEAFDHIATTDFHYARCALGLATALTTKAEEEQDQPMLAEAVRLFRVAADPASGGNAGLVESARSGMHHAEAKLGDLTAEPGRRERLLAVVQARLDADDPPQVLADDAQPELDQLLGLLAARGGLDAPVALLIGQFHLVRGGLRVGDGEKDRLIGYCVLLPVLLTKPESLPAPLRRELEQVRDALTGPGDDPVEVVSRALTNLVWLLMDRPVPRDDDTLTSIATFAAELLPEGHADLPSALRARDHAREPADPRLTAERAQQIVKQFRNAFTRAAER